MNKRKIDAVTTDFTGCQLPCVPQFAVASVNEPGRSISISIKKAVRAPWHLHVKHWLKNIYYFFVRLGGPTSAEKTAKTFKPESSFTKGDIVRVRSREEIQSTLDPFNMLKGCTFFHEMFDYCGTDQKVFKVMRNFMDERDYKYKKTRGIILLENNFCSGRSAFGECDRCCFLFWREEWLEKL